MRARHLELVVIAGMMACGGRASAAEALSEAPPHGEALTVSPGYATEVWRAATAPLVLQMSRPWRREDGEISIWVGSTDVTGSFVLAGDRLTCGPPAPPLPTGDSELVVSLDADSTSTREIGRFAVRILTLGGFESSQSMALVAINNTGQIAQERTPREPAAGRERFQDVQVTTGWSTSQTWRGWNLQTRASFLAVSERSQALRFAQKGRAAPAVDLSDYRLQLQRGTLTLALGQIQYGAASFLLEDRQGRGVQAQVSVGGRATWTAAALSGTNLVGWDDLSGLSRPRHRILASTMGLELLTAHPGAVHLSASVMDGAVLTDAGFTQGLVSDAERSRGFSLRLDTQDPSQRVAVSAEWARSRFTNPADALLSQGAELVAVRPVTRGAGSVDARLHLLVPPAGSTARPDLALHYRLERVDPLYRTVAAQVLADRLQHQADAIASWHDVAFAADWQSSEDNLAHVPTLMTTRTAQAGARAATSLARFAGSGILRAWLPTVSLTSRRVHQYGLGAPDGGGFANLSQVPDQVSVSHGGSLAWGSGSTQLSYELALSNQDNRQAGRELADFKGWGHSIRLGTALRPNLQVFANGARDVQVSREQSQSQVTLRGESGADWHPWRPTNVPAFFSGSRQYDRPRTGSLLTSELRLEAAARLGPGRSPIQVFLRFSRQYSAIEAPGLPTQRTRVWALNSGLTFALP